MTDWLEAALTTIRMDGHVTKVLWELRTELQITAVPELDPAYPDQPFWATMDRRFKVWDAGRLCYREIPYESVSEKDLTKVKIDTVISEVESLEEEDGGRRVRVVRLIFKEEQP